MYATITVGGVPLPRSKSWYIHEYSLELVPISPSGLQALGGLIGLQLIGPSSRLNSCNLIQLLNFAQNTGASLLNNFQLVAFILCASLLIFNFLSGMWQELEDSTVSVSLRNNVQNFDWEWAQCSSYTATCHWNLKRRLRRILARVVRVASKTAGKSQTGLVTYILWGLRIKLWASWKATLILPSLTLTLGGAKGCRFPSMIIFCYFYSKCNKLNVKQ